MIDKELVAKKLGSMSFRGPDHSASIHVDGITLGHNRLAIIDLDKRGNQPFTYRDLTIVYNGEIYNYIEIRERLSKVGYSFRTETDTEVLCAAYHAFGEECLNELNGMFSFVIYDSRKNILFGARDRFGQKPLYYCLVNNRFEFGSQLRSITLDKTFSVCENATSQYLLYQYVPEPKSMYREVHKVRAGHYFTYDLGTFNFNEQPYFEISTTSDTIEVSLAEAKKLVDKGLSKAVTSRLVSDVPLGVFLSGGVDSSLVTAYACAEIQNLKSFSIRFADQEFDESPYAEAIANHLGTDHTTISCDYSQGLRFIESLSKYYQEPFADSSQIPTMLLCHETRKHVTVAISGDGGDEVFLGYDRYRWMQQVRPAFALPTALRKFGATLLSLLPMHQLRMIASGLSRNSLEELYMVLVTGMSESILEEPDLGFSDEYRQFLFTSKKLPDRLSDYDIKTYLNGDINTKVDRASMSASLEVRSPFLDYKLVALAKSLPLRHKMMGSNQKIILKDLLAEKIPRELFDRPKQGFTTPFREWFRTDLKELVLDTLTDSNLNAIPNLSLEVVRKKIEDHFNGHANNHPLIWKLIVYLKWLDQDRCQTGHD